MPAEYGGFPTRTNVFVQVIEGSVKDAAAMRKTYERWHEDLAPEAVGWLASTAGVTDDGEFIAAVTFVSDEAARRNSQRPEQDEWWREMEQHFTGDVTFHDCGHVATFGAWERHDAGFVQVIQGRTPQLGDVMEQAAAAEQEFVRDHRLGLAGGLVADHGDGSFTEVIFYPSEEAARESGGEMAEQTVGIIETLSGTVADVRYLNLGDPWIHHHA